jgi:hypothetical protein
MQETFFRPEEISRSTQKLSASIFNAYRLLLTRSSGDCVFVPLRSIQFQAVATKLEIIFIDSYGPYHSQQGSAGRCISYAWQFSSAMTRHSLIEPVEYDCICYCHDPNSTGTRLITEFDRAVDDYLAKLPRKNHPTPGIKITSFR